MSALTSCDKNFFLFILIGDLFDDLDQDKGIPCVMRAYELYARCVSRNPLLKLTSTEEDCTVCACYSVIYKLYNTERLHVRDISDLAVRHRPIVVGQYWLDRVKTACATEKDREALGFAKMIAHRELSVLATARGKLFPNGIVAGGEADFEKGWRSRKFYELWQFEHCDSPGDAPMSDLNHVFYWHVHVSGARILCELGLSAFTRFFLTLYWPFQLYKWFKAVNFFMFGRTRVFVMGVDDNENPLAPEIFEHWKAFVVKHPFVLDCLSAFCLNAYGSKPDYCDAQLARLSLDCDAPRSCMPKELHDALMVFKGHFYDAMSRTCRAVLDELSEILRCITQRKTLRSGELKLDAESRAQQMSLFNQLVSRKAFFVHAWNLLNSMGYSHDGAKFNEEVEKLQSTLNRITSEGA